MFSPLEVVADSGPGKDQKNHFLEENLLIVLLRGRPQLPRCEGVLCFGGISIY